MRFLPESEFGYLDSIGQAFSLLQRASSVITIGQLVAAFPSLFNGTEQLTILASSSVNSRTIAVADPVTRQLLVIGQGMDGYENVGACLTGWALPTNPERGNPDPWATATRLVNGMWAPPANGWDRVTMIGHSFGGATMMALSLAVLNENQGCRKYVYTWGAPKPCLQGNRNGWANINVRRIFSTTDPVPALPLSITELSGLWQLLDNSNVNRWARWVQPTLGLAIRSDGTITTAENPNAGNPVAQVTNLTAWITGNDAFGSPNHSLAAYATIMATLPLSGVGGADDPTPTSRAPVVQVSAQQANAARGGTITVQAANVAAQPNTAAAAVLAQTPRVAGVRFHGGRRRGHPCVLYNGQVVIYCHSRRMVRRMTRFLNRSLLAV